MRPIVYLAFIVFFCGIVLFPLAVYAQDEPFVINVNVDLDFRPLIRVVTAPVRFILFANETISKHGNDVSQKTLALATAPIHLSWRVKSLLDKKAKTSRKRAARFFSLPLA